MHRHFERLSRAMAVAGGLMLSALILLTCLSIAGRLLNGWLHGDWVQGALPGLADTLLGWGVGPVMGDFEILEAGMAFAIFAFLPLCQIAGGHASVDILVRRMPGGVQAWLRWGAETAFALVLVLIAVQLAAGTASKVRTGQTTFLIQFPLWWSYALALLAAAVAALVALYVAAARTVELWTGRAVLPADGDAGA